MKKTQKEAVLEYMQKHKSITPLEAIIDIGAYRLSAIIYDLKKDGYGIITRLKKVKKANGEYTHVAEYMLEDKFFEENENHIPRID